MLLFHISKHMSWILNLLLFLLFFDSSPINSYNVVTKIKCVCSFHWLNIWADCSGALRRQIGCFLRWLIYHLKQHEICLQNDLLRYRTPTEDNLWARMISKALDQQKCCNTCMLSHFKEKWHKHKNTQSFCSTAFNKMWCAASWIIWCVFLWFLKTNFSITSTVTWRVNTAPQYAQFLGFP